MKTVRIQPDLSVDEIMRRWPATIGVFMRMQMLCVGCPIGTFHTIVEACTEHGVLEDAFSRELEAAIDGIEEPEPR